MTDWLRDLGERQKCVQQVAKTKAGKKMLSWLRDDVCLMDTPMVDNSAHEMAIRSGMQYVYLMIEREINKSTRHLMAQVRDMEEQQKQLERERGGVTYE